MQPGELWSLGDYAAAGDRWARASGRLAETQTRVGETVLDLACGPGPFAIAAARVGAKVTALDASGTLLDLGRARAEAADVSVEWVRADMTDVPLPDASFDLVVSVFGCMFAPEPEAMATELVRLCRTGGRIAVLAWTPESAFGAMAPMATRYLPPGGRGAPVERWSRPDDISEIFANLPVRLEFATRTVAVTWTGLDEAVDEITGHNPAWIMIRTAVEPTGHWGDLKTELRNLFASHGNHEAAGFTLPVDYLETIAHHRTGTPNRKAGDTPASPRN